MRHLVGGWLALGQRVGAGGDVAGAGATLLACWAQPQRHYHDLAHLAAVLAQVEVLAGEAETADAVRLAAWFHDAVYDVEAADNEERSAALARRTLSTLRLPAHLIETVARLVSLTATHDPVDGDLDGAVLCDADLAVLASGDAGYAAYVEGVRAEYGHLGDATFARGRAAVLHSLLDRPAMFRTAHGRAAWERRARENLAAELARLTTGAG